MKLADGFGGSNPPDATFFKELNVSITHSLQYGILHLTIDRVERRNALTAEMFADLADELDQAIMQTAVPRTIIYFMMKFSFRLSVLSSLSSFQLLC